MLPGRLDTLDLNLLRVFDVIMREGSITAAGATIGQTQSSMSHALGRLRQHLGDPLFVRTTKGMQPTPYAERLSASVANAFQALREGVNATEAFDPATSSRSYTLLTTDIAELMLFPTLVTHLSEVAPHIRVTSAQTARSDYRAQLERSAADLAIGKLPENHVDFHQQHLFDLPIGCLVRRDHPAIGESISLAQFMATPQIAMTEPAQVEIAVARAIGKRAAQRNIVLRLSHYLSVPSIINGSDLIAVMPMIGNEEWMAKRDLRLIPLPFAVPPFRIVQFWHDRHRCDEGHRWLRGIIAKLFMGRMRELHLSQASLNG